MQILTCYSIVKILFEVVFFSFFFNWRAKLKFYSTIAKQMQTTEFDTIC